MSGSPRPSSVEQLLERLPAIYFRQGLNGSFEHVGGAVEQLLGLEPGELLANPSLLTDTTPSPNPATVPPKAHGEEEAGRLLRVRHCRSGETVFLQEFRTPILSDDERVLGYEGLWLERTSWALLEQRLELASWKELACRLTQGFTHDLNNALTGLMAMSELLLSQADEKHPLHDVANVVRQSALKATDLVRRLNQMLGSAPGKGEFSDAGITLTESLELLHKAVPRRVRLTQEIASEPLPVRADAWRLRLVLLQLILNALEAMPDGGTLYIQAARSQAAPPGAPSVGQLPPGPWIRLSISDTGPAFAAGGHVFQPWFGTKASQKGTGLGLFVARKFCEENGAALFLASKENLGTTLELWLQEADLEAPESASPETKRLLLSGVNTSQIAELATLCRGNGFSVVVCPELQGVARLLAVNPAEFDAVVLAGAEADLKPVLRWLRREKLQVRVVLLSDGLETPDADLLLSSAEPETFLRRLNSLLS